MQQDVEALIEAHPHYRLAPFAEILREVLAHWGSLAGLDCMELGPGNRVDMMRFLASELDVKSIRGVGSAPLWPWTGQRDFIRAHVVSSRFLPYFEKAPAAGFDLIYSRHVMEQHSIHPWMLLRSRAYWSQFKKARFNDFDERYPASPQNLQATFRAAWNTLRPGGLIVSQIGKRKYGCLDEGFLATLDPQPGAIRRRDLGTPSSMVTVIKS